MAIEELPLLQADLTYGDLLRDGQTMHAPQPSLFAITMLPPHTPESLKNNGPPIPPHPSIVQRRMELLTADMLSRALTLVSRGQQDRAQPLLSATQNVLRGLGKGSLPPLPTTTTETGGGKQTPPPLDSNSNRIVMQSSPSVHSLSVTTESSPSPLSSSGRSSSESAAAADCHHHHLSIMQAPAAAGMTSPTPSITPSIITTSSPPPQQQGLLVDTQIMTSLDADLATALEWIMHPGIFARDSRKAVLQAIGVISSQRAYTFRTPSEAHFAARVAGIRRLTERSKEWREREGSAPVG